MDYHYGYNYTNSLRIKAFTSDVTRTVSPGIVSFNCMVENNIGTTTFKWYQNEALISGANNSTLNWAAPSTSGTYAIRCEVSADYKTVQSPVINIIVAPEGEIPPEINILSLSGTAPYATSGIITAEASISPATASFNWSCSGGTLQNSSTLSPAWQLPDSPGIYTLTLTVDNLLGTVAKTRQVLVKDMQSGFISDGLVAYYPLNGDTNNAAQDRFHAVSYDAVMAPDQRGNADHAYAFSNSSQYVAIPPDAALNFTDKLSVSLWVKPEELPAYEQFVISHGSYEERYKMSITPERKMRWTLKTSNGIVDVDDDTALQTGTFVHYAGQYTGYSLELYRNGHLIAWKPLSGAIGTSNKSITLARKDESETNYSYKGTVDEVRIYNTELPVKYIEKLPAMWDLASGINNPEYTGSISIYPNPFQSSFTVRFDEKGSACSLSIFNLQGKRLFHQQNLRSGDLITPDKLSSGMYLLQTTSVTGKKVMVILLKKN
jgi:PKD repeat protein